VLVWVLLAVVAYLVAGVGVTGQTVFDRVSTGAPAVPGPRATRRTRSWPAAPRAVRP